MTDWIIRRRALTWGLLALILALAACLRLANLVDNPGWYTDEGTHLDIARHLLAGRTQYLAITHSTLLFAKLPLFAWLLAGAAHLFGLSMLTLRGVTAVLGLLSVALLYGVVRRVTADALLALLAALMLAVYPQAVLYSRFGFSYNLLTPLFLLAALGLWEYGRHGGRKWLALAALAIGLGILSDLLMVSLLPVVVLVVAWQRWRDLTWSLFLAGLPFGLYATVALLTLPHAFYFDWQFTLFRLNSLSLPRQASVLAENYTILLAQDSWLAVGLVGLFLLRPLAWRRLCLLLFFVPLLVLGRTTALHGLSFYYLIPFLPLVALGMAAVFRYGVPHITQTVGLSPGAAAVATLLILATPLVTTTLLTAARVQGTFGTAVDPFLINGADARAAAGFINAHLQPGDVVIASPAVAWLVQGNTADFQQAIAATGQATPHLPGDIPPDRFAFDPTYIRARFVVVDNLWHNWAAFNVPGVGEMMWVVGRWPLLYDADEIKVYENPILVSGER